MLWALVLIGLGVLLLAKGATYLVDGSCAIARHYRVPDLVIGLTVVALGTSAPELVVSLIAAGNGEGGLALGNVIGSNIANLCLVLGGAGVLAPIAIRKGTVWREIPFCFGVTVLLLVVVLAGSGGIVVSRPEAVALLLAMGLYLVFMFRLATEPPPGPVPAAPRRTLVSVLMVVGGLIGLLGGGELIVRGSLIVARGLRVSQELVGVTIVALGTSLPELATSVAAVLKGRSDIAVGNVVGSNILNTCLVLGCAGMVRPLAATQPFHVDMAVMVAASLLLFVFMFTGRRGKLDRWESWLFLALYAGYLAFAVARR